MSDQTPAGQKGPATKPNRDRRSDREPDQADPTRRDDQSQDEGQNSAGKDEHKPTLVELMLGASLEQPNQADEPEEHKPTLAELVAAGKELPQPDQPPKVETSLRDMVAEALAESDSAQGERADFQQDADRQGPGASDAEPQGPDGQDVQTDLLQEAATVPAEVDPERPQVAAPQAPPAAQEEPAPTAPAYQAKIPRDAREGPPAVVQGAEKTGAQQEPSEAAEGKAPSDQAPCEPEEAAGVVEEPRIVARYGLMRHTGQFRHNLEVLPAPGTMIVVRTHRGVELAEVVSCICDDQHPGCITRERLATYVAADGQDYPLRCEGSVLRVANQQDLADRERISASAKQEAAFCRQCAKEMHLAIKIVSVDHLLGEDRIVFYFTADRRVDFRALVQKLSSQYHTRIEMRQVGARDEARLVADYEKCGQRCCCQAFLKDLKPVSMRMAKIQKASLDPAKISGRCGRLMCCMRFEDETYEELRKKLPAKKTWVRTRELCGKVIDTSILAQLVSVSLPDGRSEVIANEEIIERDVQPPAAAKIGSGPGDASPGRSSPASDQPGAKARARETQARQAESSASDQELQNQPPAPAASARAKKRRGPGRSRHRRDKRADPPDRAEP